MLFLHLQGHQEVLYYLPVQPEVSVSVFITKVPLGHRDSGVDGTVMTGLHNIKNMEGLSLILICYLFPLLNSCVHLHYYIS